MADILIRLIHGSERMAMAGPLKDIVATMFNWDREMLEGRTIESRQERMKPDARWDHLAGHGIFKDVISNGISPILVLQRLGTDLIRHHIHDDFWLDLMRIRAKASTSPAIIIPDIRFPNELAACDITICITRPIHDGIDLASLHISEVAHLDHHFDFTITNDGSIQDLEAKVIHDILPGIQEHM